MKKPKITEGEWNNLDNLVCSSTKGLLADCSNIQGDDVDQINAKAISAVPEMIESLMGVMHAIEECRLDNGGVALGDVLEEKVKSALIKAGAFDD